MPYLDKMFEEKGGTNTRLDIDVSVTFGLEIILWSTDLHRATHFYPKDAQQLDRIIDTLQKAKEKLNANSTSESNPSPRD